MMLPEYIALPKQTTALNNELSREKSAATVGAHEPAPGIPRIHRNSAFYTASANSCHSPVRLDSGKAAIREQDRLLVSPSLLFMIFHS
jgi:hypothetical protein